MKRKSIVQTEPVLTAAGVAGAIIALASVFDVVLDADTVTTVVAALLPIVLAAFARQKVSPVQT